jgi:hypothetical protein
MPQALHRDQTEDALPAQADKLSHAVEVATPVGNYFRRALRRRPNYGGQNRFAYRVESVDLGELPFYWPLRDFSGLMRGQNGVPSFIHGERFP